MGPIVELAEDGDNGQGLYMLPKDLLSNNFDRVPLVYKHHPLYKTVLCRKWQNAYFCPYGSECQFAHGMMEIRATVKHPMYKTKHCYWFKKGVACPYGTRCIFIH